MQLRIVLVFRDHAFASYTSRIPFANGYPTEWGTPLRAPDALYRSLTTGNPQKCQNIKMGFYGVEDIYCFSCSVG